MQEISQKELEVPEEQKRDSIIKRRRDREAPGATARTQGTTHASGATEGSE